MKAISIRQPWAWLIVNGYKDIENRTWATKFRGNVLIHASKGMTKAEYDAAVDFAFWRYGGCSLGIPSFDELQRGGIVGVAEIVDCVSKSDSPWFVGDYGFVLRNARKIEFKPITGRLGFFDVPEIVL
ncbi:MAG TPA: ASCH domain-containing protein [Noviherbaspirillum sp.]|nr:ASCH domain-containing protein [Noviherbaspirillum sp.]